MGRCRVGWVVVALAVVAAGCGGGDDDKQPAPQQTPGDTSAEATATAEGDQAPAESEPIVETLGSIDGGRARFMLTELRRSGATVILNARLELVDTAAGNRLQVGSTFDDGTFQELEDGATEPGDVFDGVALIDPEGKKKYFVARDETNRCVCSNSSAPRSSVPTRRSS